MKKSEVEGITFTENYDLGDKSENLRRMNHFEKFNKANRNFFLQKMLDFSIIICAFWR